MIDFPLNIADFRSLHVVKARRHQHQRLECAPQFDSGPGLNHHSVLNIEALRDAWRVRQFSDAGRGDRWAKIICFADHVSRRNPSVSSTQSSDPLDCPPAA